MLANYSTHLYRGQPPLNLYYRPLKPSDYAALKEVHKDLFPIDYEDVFFRKAVAGDDRVFSWAALHSEYGTEHLVGFVTARIVYLYECDPVDRTALGLASRALDGHCCVYVLTLGVVASCRQCGVARTLLTLVAQHAERLRCRAIFLHVISYNDAAMRLYGNAGYQPLARLPNFYNLVTGRQPNPEQSWYDAFLYAAFLPSTGPEPSPAMQWAGGVLGAAVAPLRSVLGTFNGCMPSWLCRQSYGSFLPFTVPAPQQTAPKASQPDTAGCALGWQPPGVPPVPPPPPPTRRPTEGDAGNGLLCGSSAAWLAQQDWGQGQGPAQGPDEQRGEQGNVWRTGWGPGHHVGAGGDWSQTGVAAAAGAGPRQRLQGSCSAGGAGGAYGNACPVAEGAWGPQQAADGAASAPPYPLSRAPHTPAHTGGWGPGLGGDGSAGQRGHVQDVAWSLQSQHQHNHQQHRWAAAGSDQGAGGGAASAGYGHHAPWAAEPLPAQQPQEQRHQQQGVPHSHGRSGEPCRGGIQWGPRGLAGGGLYPQHRQPQDEQGQPRHGSLLASLFRPPGGTPHRRSR